MFLTAYKLVFCAVILEGNLARSIQNVTNDGNTFVTVDMLEAWKKNMTDIMTDMIEKKKAEDVQRVDFHAKMISSNVDLNKNSIVKFSHVLNNEGHHFNSGDSIFISPVSGVYLFSWSTQSQGSHNVNTELRVDNVVKETLTSNMGASGILSVTRVVVCKVKKSDHVWIQTSGSFADNLFDYEHGSQSSFTGVLLYPI